MLSQPARRRTLIAVLRKVAMIPGRVTGADLGSVLVEGDVPDPVEPVLYAPVALDPTHPVVGDLDPSFEALDVSTERGLQLIAFTAAAGSPTSDAMNLLASWTVTTTTAEIT